MVINSINNQINIQPSNNIKKDNCDFEFTLSDVSEEKGDEGKPITYMHYLYPSDVELKMYCSDEVEGCYKVDTFSNGKYIKSQTINPENINPRQASYEEMMVLDYYYYDKGMLAPEDSMMLTSMLCGYQSGQHNFVDIGNYYMGMQFDTNNLEAYSRYQKILALLLEG